MNGVNERTVARHVVRQTDRVGGLGGLAALATDMIDWGCVLG